MSTVLERAAVYVEDLFRRELSPSLSYHTLEHTRLVVRHSEFIAANSSVTQSDLEPLLLAAWFHDTGYTVKYAGHEEESQRIARYRSEADFVQPGGYYDDMVDAALADLAAQLERAWADTLRVLAAT